MRHMTLLSAPHSPLRAGAAAAGRLGSGATTIGTKTTT
jgi:hypothetical protein